MFDRARQGCWHFGCPAGGAAYFTGSLDDIRIYNYAMSATDVSALYNAAVTAP